MKILLDLDLHKRLKTDEINKIKAQIQQIEDTNYDEYFVKTLVVEINGTVIEMQFDYTSNEVYVREC